VNSYSFDEISIGQEESFMARISSDEMKAFQNITGDENPLHSNDDYARNKGYKGRVAYGMLTASFLSTVAGMYLPGEHSLIQEITVKFVAPVEFVSDEDVKLSINAKVVGKHDLFKRLELKVRIVDESDTLVLRANMKVGVSE
jgi:acyl dehydratase